MPSRRGSYPNLLSNTLCRYFDAQNVILWFQNDIVNHSQEKWKKKTYIFDFGVEIRYIVLKPFFQMHRNIYFYNFTKIGEK